MKYTKHTQLVAHALLGPNAGLGDDSVRSTKYFRGCGAMAEMTPEGDEEFAQLRAENARLASLLDAHGIAWQLPVATPANATPLSTQEKVALFRRLFRGRIDVYPVRWESKAGKSGYSPACTNEWRPGICEKPRIKCSDCGHRLLMPLTDQTIYDHLAVDAARSWISRYKSPFVVSVIRTGDAGPRSAGYSEQSPWWQTTNVTRRPL
jgi:TOTE conflict system primase-like protein